MLTVVFLSGILTVVSLLAFVARIIPMKLFFGYATYIDVTFTVLMFIIFEGTLGGALTATAGGLFLSAVLTAGRYVFGYSRVKYLRRCGFIMIDYPPKLKAKWSK